VGRRFPGVGVLDPWQLLEGGRDGLGALYPVLAGFVARGRDRAVVRTGFVTHADDDRFADQVRVPQPFTRGVKAVHVDVDDDAIRRTALRFVRPLDQPRGRRVPVVPGVGSGPFGGRTGTGVLHVAV